MKWYQHIFGDVQKHAKYASKDDAAKKELARKEAEAKREKARREAILKSPKQLYKHIDEFSPDEVKKAIERFQTKQKLAEFAKNDVERGQKYLESISKSIGNLAVMYNWGAQVYNAFKDDDQKEAPIIAVSKKKDKDKDKK